MTRLRQSISLMLALAFAAGICIGAAADAPVTDSDAATSQGRLEVIIVTAQRREEALQDVPISVTALSADTFTDLAVGRARGR